MPAEEIFNAARHQEGGFICDKQQKTRGINILPLILKSEVFKIIIICKKRCKTVLNVFSRQKQTEE